MDKVFQIASSISTPIALAGFLAAATFYIFRQILAKNIFPQLTALLGSQIIRAIIDKLFYLSLVAMLLGFLAYLAKPLLDKAVAGPSAAERMASHAATLSTGSPEARIVALTELGKIEASSRDETESLTKILATHINRIGAVRRAPISYDTRAEMSTAFHAIAHLLRRSDQQNLVFSRPKFMQLDASNLDLEGIYLARVTFADSTLSETVIDNATLTAVELIGVDARKLTARNADFSAALIQQTCLEEAVFSNANFDRAIFRSSDLNNSNLSGANLASTVMENSRLSLVNLQGADLKNADFTGAFEISRPQVNEGRSVETTKLPELGFRKSNLAVCRR